MRTYIKGVFYKEDGDSRMHSDIDMLDELYRSIPERAADVCPECGALGCTGCRCPADHRSCRVCHVGWQWVIDKDNATIKRIPDFKMIMKMMNDLDE